jgi:hypothetical protein
MIRRRSPRSAARSGRSAAARVSATEAARNFSDLVSRVLYNSDVFVVERGGREVCEIRPVYASQRFTAQDLVALLGSLPAPGDAYLEAVERAVAEQGPSESVRWRRS